MVIVRFALLAYIIAILGVVAMSWFPQAAHGSARDLYAFLRRITDPVLQPLRRLIPPIGGAIDLSPTIALIVLWIVYSAL